MWANFFPLDCPYLFSPSSSDSARNAVQAALKKMEDSRKSVVTYNNCYNKFTGKDPPVANAYKEATSIACYEELERANVHNRARSI